MASSTKQMNSNQQSQNNPCGKRKKSKGSKGSYLSKWLEKMQHQDTGSFPSFDADMFVNPNVNWHTGNSQFGPGYDNFRPDMYGCMPGHMSLPTLLTHYNPLIPSSEYRCVQNENKNIQVQRPRTRKSNRSKAEELSSAQMESPNHTHYHFQPKTFSDSQDYTSLPPIITSAGDTNSVSDVQTNDKDDTNARRFSDPVVRGLPDVARPANGEVESESDSDSDLSGSQVGGRLLTYLLDQISSLKAVNERMNRELIETKAELESVKHQAYYPQAQTNYGTSGVGGQYSPGFLTELLREVRDATRIREEAMYARVRAMVHERVDSGLVSSESKTSERALEEIKSSLRASDADKRRMMDRISKLEDELRSLRLTNGQEHTDNKVTNGNDENAECDRLRKALADMGKAKQNADDRAHKLERLVTQMRSKFNGLQITNGPDSLPSDQEHEPTRIRRISSSTNNSTNNLSNSVLNTSTNILNSSNNVTTSTTNSSFGHNLAIPTSAAMVFGLVTDL